MPIFNYLMSMGPSTSKAMASRKVVYLYYAISKQLPQVIDFFETDYDLKKAKQIIRNKFYANANLTDLAAIDRLLYQSAMEVDEIVEQFARLEHFQEHMEAIPNFPSVELKKPGSDPLERFLHGVDNI